MKKLAWSGLGANVNKVHPLRTLVVALALTALGSVPALAAAPLVKTPGPGVFRVMVGDFEVTALSDGTVELPVNKLLKQDAAITDRELAAHFLKSPLETSDNTFLVNTGSKLVLVDTGAGTLFGPTLGKLLINLKAAGYTPDQVDEIYITHMHPDHVGGLVLNGVPAFPNAVVRANRHDADYWLSPAHMEQAPAASKGYFQAAMGSLNPYVTAGRYRSFDGATELMPGIHSVPSKGHTGGHTAYLIESQGQKLLLIGDLIHVAAVQFDHPEVGISFDSEGTVAVAERLKDFAAFAKDGTLVAGAHLPFPGMGHVVVRGKGYEWLPVNFTQMH